MYVLPRPEDIKCGQGSINFKHPGNQYLRALIQPEVESYHACTERREKTFVIREVIAVVYNEGGRFLKHDKKVNQWYDGGLQTAKLRVGSAFRDAVANLKSKRRLTASVNASEKQGTVARVDRKELGCLTAVDRRTIHPQSISKSQDSLADTLISQNKAHHQFSPSYHSLPWLVSPRNMLQLWASALQQQPHVIFVPSTENVAPSFHE